jgi:MOSC domain-containing protein YiiM
MTAKVLAVHRSSSHSFSKYAEDDGITLVEGLGVEGDAHAGATVKHRSRVKRDPSSPNLRQVHLLQSELFDALLEQDHAVFPGDLGENVTTRGIDLLALPTGTVLRLGEQAEVELTGLRNPCSQIDRFQPGLMAKVLEHDANGRLIRKAGVMAVVRRGGRVGAGDAIVVRLPQHPHHALEPV